MGPRALQPTIDRSRGKRVRAVEWARGLIVILVWSLCAFMIFVRAVFIAAVIR